MNSFLRKHKNIIMSITAVIAIAVIVMPTAISILYSIPASDDFAAALTVKKGNAIITSIKTANDMYMIWGGIWSFYFLEDLMNPLVYFDVTRYAVGIELLVIFVIFLISIIFMVDAILELIIDCHRFCNSLWISTLLLLIFINTEVYTDVYYWFVGNCYMWGLILNNIVIILSIKYLNNIKSSFFRTALLSMYGFFSCLDYRGALLSGVIYILLVIVKIREDSFLKIQIIPLLFMIAGGITAVVAPGNYRRQASIIGAGSVWKAFIDAGWDEVYSLRMAFTKPIIITACIGLVVIGMFWRIRIKNVIIAGMAGVVLAVLIGYLNYFPLALGYGSRDLPSRITFGFYFQFFVLFCFALIFVGNSLSKFVITRKGYCIVLGWMPVLLCALIIITGHYRDMIWYTTVSNLQHTREVSNGWKHIYSEIKDSREEDVVVNVPAFYLGTVLMTPQFGDKDNYVNVTAAKYFGKKSLTVNVDWERLFYD